MGTAWRKVLWGCLGVLVLAAMHGCQRDGDEVSLLDTLDQEGQKLVPIFANNGDGTVTDMSTGLIWLQDADCFGAGPQSQALTAVNNLADGMCGLSDQSCAGDWRVPHIKEFLSLFDYAFYNPALPEGHSFVNIQEWYWSSTPSTSFDGQAVIANFIHGGTGDIALDFAASVIPVRGPAYESTSHLFDDGDGTVIDTATGLIWLKEANCFGTKIQTDAFEAANTLASGMCGLSDGSRTGDWRLPDVKELESLLDFSQHEIGLPADHPFVHVATYYWSSTPFVWNPSQAWTVYLSAGELGPAGDVGADSVATPGYVLPVRDAD